MGCKGPASGWGQQLPLCCVHSVTPSIPLQNGNAAASLAVAEQYVSAFSQLAKDSNTILLPSNTGDVTSMVTQVSTGQRCLTACWAHGSQQRAQRLQSRRREIAPGAGLGICPCEFTNALT